MLLFYRVYIILFLWGELYDFSILEDKKKNNLFEMLFVILNNIIYEFKLENILVDISVILYILTKKDKKVFLKLLTYLWNADKLINW